MPRRALSVLYEWGSAKTVPTSLPAGCERACGAPRGAAELSAVAEALLRRPSADLRRDVPAELAAIALLEASALVGIADLEALGRKAAKCDAEDAFDAEADAMDLAVTSAEGAMELLWGLPTDPLEGSRRAMAIGAAVLASVRSYRTIGYFGWAQLRCALNLPARGSGGGGHVLGAMGASVEYCASEAFADLGARLSAASYAFASGGLGDEEGGRCPASPPRDEADELAFAADLVASTAPIELRCAVSFGVCGRYTDAAVAMEGLVRRMAAAAAARQPRRRTAQWAPSDVAANCLALAYAVLASALSALTDGNAVGRAVLATEAALDRLPAHPLPHLCLCLLHHRLGGHHEAMATRLGHVLRALHAASASIVACGIAAVAAEEGEGSAAAMGGAFPSAGAPPAPPSRGGAPPVGGDGGRAVIALTVLTANVALQCGCDALCVEAADLGIRLVGVRSPPDEASLAALLTLKADVCLRRSMAAFHAAAAEGCASSAPDGGASSQQQRREGEEMLIQSERHTFRSLQLRPSGKAHCLDGRRLLYMCERAGPSSDEGAAFACSALLAFKAAIACEPLWEAFEGAGDCHSRAGRLEEAADMLLQSVSLQAQQPLIPFHWFVSIL